VPTQSGAPIGNCVATVQREGPDALRRSQAPFSPMLAPRRNIQIVPRGTTSCEGVLIADGARIAKQPTNNLVEPDA
jgi:hypothetical protein